MNAHDAAEQLKRQNFQLEMMAPEDRLHVEFVEAVASELGVQPTAFNLYQVAKALDDANIHEDSREFPKMLYSRQHHAIKDVEPSVYDPRHDWVQVHVADEDQVKALGSDWVEDPNRLPPRGDTSVNAPEPAPSAAVTQAPIVEPLGGSE